jgi:tetratricopeptide (TPR) repeat protein
MHSAANTNCFFKNLSSIAGFADLESIVSPVGLYRHVSLTQLTHALYSHQTINSLANNLTWVAERAYNLRDFEVVQEASRALAHLPSISAQHVGTYYKALASYRNGQAEESWLLLEKVLNDGPPAYRARAMQAMGALYYDIGKSEDALKYHIEALRMTSLNHRCDLLTVLLAHLEISHIASDQGDHQRALYTLEKALPIVRLVANENPYYFYLFQNELACELGENGRLAEAEAATLIALSSPYASAYPNWAETRQEITAKRLSASKSQTALRSNPSPSPDRSTRSKPDRKPALALFRGDLARRAIYQAAPPSIGRIAIASPILKHIRKCLRPRSPPATR